MASVVSPSLRDAWTRQLIALGDDAQAIESSFQDAQAVTRLHASRLNDFNTAASLPTDILEPIFLAVQDEYRNRVRPLEPPSRARYPWSSEAGWIFVTHVCHRWRSTALNFPQFWVHIDTRFCRIPFCKEMMLRLRSQRFSLTMAYDHQELLSSFDLRERVPRQLQSLMLFFTDTVRLPGAVLDHIFSRCEPGTGAELETLELCSSIRTDLYWGSLEHILPHLRTLRLTSLYPVGPLPSTIPMLRVLRLTTVHLTATDWVPGILHVIQIMPVLETASFIDCIFSASPHEAKVDFPTTVKTVSFVSSSEWFTAQCCALAHSLRQSSGERTFDASSTFDPVVIHSLFDDIGATIDSGHSVREITLVFGTWNLDVTVEFHTYATKSDRPLYRIHYPHVFAGFWPTFCSVQEELDLKNTCMRIICNNSAPVSNIPHNIDLAGLKGSKVSSIQLSGSLTCSSTFGLFNALREPQDAVVGLTGTTLGFTNLESITIGSFAHPIPTKPEDVTAEKCLSDLDESALYLIWYARARRYRTSKPLRMVALPAELIHRPWVEELNELLEQRVVLYDAYVSPPDPTSACQAVVLYRPFLQKFWETRKLWVFSGPLIAMLGLLWTRSHRS